MKHATLFIARLLIVCWTTALFATEPDPGESSGAPTTGSGSEVTGKGGGMGRSYQQHVPDPGAGNPEYRGGRGGHDELSTQGNGASPTENSSVNNDATQPEQTSVSEQDVRSFRARDGSGYGTGQPYDQRTGTTQGAPNSHDDSHRSPDTSDHNTANH